MYRSNTRMSNLPRRNQIILCHTSLWMMIPILVSRDDFFKFNLLLNMIFSMLHWNHFNNGSKFQFLDRMFSIITLSYLTCKSNPRPLPGVMILFIIGSYFWHLKEFKYHLCFHLLFRMTAFCWCCMYCNHVNQAVWMLYLCLHVLHIVYLLMNVQNTCIKYI